MVVIDACTNPVDTYRLQGCKLAVRDILVSLYGQEMVNANPDKVAEFSNAKCKEILGGR